MATRTRTGNSVKTEKVYKSKSDHARALFAEGKTVAEVTRLIDMGYAFAYGVAKRSGFAESAAKRKATRRVSVQGDLVIVQTAAGPVTVHADGTVSRPTVKTPRKVKTPA